MNATLPLLTNDFETILDRCLNELQTGRRTRDECLERYPHFAAQLKPLLSVTTLFRAAPQVTLRSEARDALEQRLQSRMRELPAPRASAAMPARSRFRRWLWVAVVAQLLIVAITASTVSAAAGSMPGDLLYPVKRWSESVAVQFAGTEEHANLQLIHAQRRLDEFQILASRGNVNPTLLDDALAETNDAIVLSNSMEGSVQAVVLTHAATLSENAIETVTRVRNTAPQAALAGLDRALAALTEAQERAQSRLPSKPTPIPKATDTPQATNTPTPTPTPTPEPVPNATPAGQSTLGDPLRPTPPGHGTPGGGLTKTPPGQGTPGRGLTQTPSGQGTPAGRGDKPPPGQKPTKTK